MTRFKANINFDMELAAYVMILTLLGVAMIYSASAVIALKSFGGEAYFLKRQAMFAAVGTVCLVLFSLVPYNFYKILTYPAILMVILLLAAVYVPNVGVGAGGASRWIDMKIIRFQPSEVARAVMVFYLAYSLSKKDERIKTFSVGFLPHVMVLAVLVALIFFQPDFGAVVILFIITWLMMFMAGVKFTYLASAVLLLLPAAYWLVYHAEYRLKRWVSFLNPWAHPENEGYQIIHSLMAFGTGGFWGTGMGKGMQKLFFLPEPHTDFIFSVIGEELGFIGVTGVIVLYVLIIRKGIITAKNANDRFGMLLAAGITISLALQAFVNTGVALGLLPTTGLTLPFLSYGGTSLIVNMVCAGVLINISVSSKRDVGKNRANKSKRVGRRG